MTEILQTHITAARLHRAVRRATTREAAAVEAIAEEVPAVEEATAVAEVVAVPAEEEDSTTIKTDI